MEWDLGPNQYTAAAIVQHPPPPQAVHRYGGGGLEGSKSKNSLGDDFDSQNNDFTRNSTSDTAHWGTLHDMGVCITHACT